MPFDLSISYIIAGIFFGMIGLIIFKEGKKRSSTELFFLGVALMVYPYFITDDIWVWVVGVLLTAVSFKLLV